MWRYKREVLRILLLLSINLDLMCIVEYFSCLLNTEQKFINILSILLVCSPWKTLKCMSLDFDVVARVLEARGFHHDAVFYAEVHVETLRYFDS